MLRAYDTKGAGVVRQLRIQFPKRGVTGIVTLLEKEAPETCDRIWDALDHEIERRVIHAAYSGQNFLFYNLPPIREPQALRLENHQTVARPGDIMFFYQPAGRLAGLDEIRDWLHPSGEVYEVVFSYGETDLRSPAIEGWRGCKWATITEGLDEVARVGRAMRTDGAETITVERFVS